jgi:hypothetical protein
MTDLTITDTEAFPGGYTFRRSDGRQFFMRLNQDGSASVFAGMPDRSPQDGISDLAVPLISSQQASFSGGMCARTISLL